MGYFGGGLVNIDLKKYKKLRFLILRGGDLRRGADSRETTVSIKIEVLNKREFIFSQNTSDTILSERSVLR